MPALSRPGGIEIHWEERGEGPGVVFADQFFGPPDVFEPILSDLARDHRLCRYDMRGIGESTRTGPYDMATDVDDLRALLEELGDVSVVLAVGNGCHRAVKVLAADPSLADAVVSPAGSPLSRESLGAEEGLAGSDSVVDAFSQMMRTDYRSTLRTIIETMNPEMEVDAIRDRIERTLAHAPQEQAVERLEAWLNSDATEEALVLGDRLWLLLNPNNPWFTAEGLEQARRVLPDAHVIRLEQGPVTDPAPTTAVVRELSAKRAEA